MKIITRRDFLSVASAAATSSALLGPSPNLYAGIPAFDSGSSDHAGLNSLIFPQPQHISATSDPFLLDDGVRILVPQRPSKQDSFSSPLLLPIWLQISRKTSARWGSGAGCQAAVGDNPAQWPELLKQSGNPLFTLL